MVGRGERVSWWLLGFDIRSLSLILGRILVSLFRVRTASFRMLKR